MLYEILRLNVQNTTPLLIGGYDTNARSELHEEELRTQSIKGLWRWWFRAFLAGRYLSQGYKDIVEKVNDEVGKILGSAGKKTSRSSVLALRFRPESINYQKEDANLREIPRVKLLMLRKNEKKFKESEKKEKEFYYIESLNGVLSVYSLLSQEESMEGEDIKTAVLSLISGLLFSGIGKGGRRGLGCLDFKILEDKVGLPESLKKWILPDLLRDILKEALSIKKHVKVENYPPIPSIAPNFFKLWYIPLRGKDIMGVLKVLQEFTLRTKRRMVIPEDGEDPFRLKLKAWILGLPRQIKGTGYLIPHEKIQRRASPLIFSVHKNFSTVCLFKSSDWPDNVKWIGGSGKLNINIKRELDSAYEFLESMFLKYMEKRGYDVHEVKIW